MGPAVDLGADGKWTVTRKQLGCTKRRTRKGDGSNPQVGEKGDGSNPQVGEKDDGSDPLVRERMLRVSTTSSLWLKSLSKQ